MVKITKKDPLLIKLYTDKATVSNKICPATIFANNRKARLTDLKTKEINSIKIKKGLNLKGTPGTKKNSKKRSP
jgi:hypothetical protein